MASKLDFPGRVMEADPAARHSRGVRTLMLNVGRQCQLSCSHCHHRCSPEAEEAMPLDVMEAALALARRIRPEIIDVTGGSPELWPLLPELLHAASASRLPLRLRTNLMTLAEDEELAALLGSHRVTVLASLPGASDASVRATRGQGVFERSLRALEVLSRCGYGSEGGPVIELAWNPETGLPPAEIELEEEMRIRLEPLGVRIGRVRAIANVPLGKYRDSLQQRDMLEPYLTDLAGAFDTRALPSLPCRDGVEVGWDGTLFDCDFNLAAGLAVTDGPRTVWEALEDPGPLVGRRITFATHCFACTVGAGSG